MAMVSKAQVGYRSLEVIVSVNFRICLNNN